MKKYTLLVLPFLFWGCKKDPIKVDSATEKNFSFKTGSYWVYRDSLSGKVDSFFVSRNGSNVDDNNVEYKATYLEVRGDSSEIGAGYYLHKNNVDFSFVQLNTGCGFTYPYSSDKKILADMSLNGSKYDSVAEILGGNWSYYYACASVGIIKMRIMKDGVLNRVWELQRYKIQ